MKKNFKENIEKSICFLDSIHLSQRDYGVTQHPYFRNIEKRLVVDLLEKINVHEANELIFNLIEAAVFKLTVFGPQDIQALQKSFDLTVSALLLEK